MFGLGPLSSLSSSCCSLASELANWGGPVRGPLALAACPAGPRCDSAASSCRDAAVRCLSRACGKPSEGLLPEACPLGRLHASKHGESISNTPIRCVAVCHSSRKDAEKVKPSKRRTDPVLAEYPLTWTWSD